MPGDETILDLVLTYGPSAVRAATIETLGFPLPMVTSFSEAERIREHMEKSNGT